ncbi:MAG: hypothetical protein CSB49_02755 [Proteobacteria bacterium]|nr:MAG: hypothetical protein CSB49_02755 [Pseudomonadota bacterium]
MEVPKALGVASGLFWLLLASPAAAELKTIWAVGESTKVKANLEGGAAPHPLAASNETFDGKRVRLFGLRNEVLAFQLILRGGAAETTGVTVELRNIGSIANAKTVSDDGDRYYLGRRIELFVQHYFRLDKPSATSVWKPGSAAQPAPEHSQGLIPDALVPHRRPFAVAARRRQGIWIDVYVPKGTPAGVHRGELVVKIAGEVCGLPGCKLPVELEVLSETMPDASRTKTMVFFSGWEDDRDSMPSRYLDDWKTAPKAKVDALRARHFKLGRRHRLTFFIGNQRQPDETLRRRLTGVAFTRAAGYEGPGEGLGQDMYSVSTFGIHDLSRDEAERWLAFFARHGAKAEVFYYGKDEPQSAKDFAEVRRRAAAAKPMATFVTTSPRDDLAEVDIFCAGTNQFSVKAARHAERKGKRVWVYNGNRPFSGTFVTDDVLAALRVNPWIQHRYGIPRWFFWEATYYKDFQGKRGQVDIWNQPLNFSNKHGDEHHGDGLLVYPGRDRRFPRSDRGFDFPLPSLRLKAWRRGIQDVEYLVLLEAKGRGAFARTVAETMVPRALSDELSEDDPVSWPEDGERWIRARKLLFSALAGGNAPRLEATRIARPPEPWHRRALRWLRVLLDPVLRSRRRRIVSATAVGGFLLVTGLMAWRRRRTSSGEKKR